MGPIQSAMQSVMNTMLGAAVSGKIIGNQEKGLAQVSEPKEVADKSAKKIAPSKSETDFAAKSNTSAISKIKDEAKKDLGRDLTAEESKELLGFSTHIMQPAQKSARNLISSSDVKALQRQLRQQRREQLANKIAEQINKKEGGAK